MLRKLAALASRTRAPRTTLVFRRPVRAIRFVRGRHDLTRGPAAERWALGLGAAVLMLPIGFWLGRKRSH